MRVDLQEGSRSSASLIDRANDEADRAAGHRLASPRARRRDRRDWANDVPGASIASGHHMAEEAPEQLAETLQAFFS